MKEIEKQLLSREYYNKQEAAEYPKNSFDSDLIIQKYLPFYCKDLSFKQELSNYGEKCGTLYLNLSKETELFKPVFEKYDAYGNEINKIYTTGAWREFKKEGCIEKIASYQYQIGNVKLNRLIQMIKVYMLSTVSGLSDCPLSMTDGGAFIIKYLSIHDKELVTNEMNNAYNNIISTNHDKFYTSSQWMTEILGGSDVRNSTETVALYHSEGNYKLYGLKWFTSAIDADVSFTLAKIYDDKTGKIDDKPTLFFLKVKEGNNLNNISIIRLKDKLGTRQLPTAELILKGTNSQIASPRAKGISYIMKLANITRLHTMCNSVGYMRGALFYVQDYSNKRKVFSKNLIEQDSHFSTLKRLEYILEGNLVFCLEMSLLVGELYGSLSNAEIYNKIESLLRLLLPLGKMYCGRESEIFCLDCIQSLGAVGYMENSGIPGILRDTMVNSIWEGTFNTLAMEFIKVYKAESFLFWDFINSFKIKDSKYTKLLQNLLDLCKNDINYLSFYTKEFCFLLSNLVITTNIISKNEMNPVSIFWLNKLEDCYQYFCKLTKFDIGKERFVKAKF